MRTISSFSVDHDTLRKGLYVSRVDRDVVTYDLRMKTPNGGEYLSTAAAHTLEHLLATYVRNSPLSDSVIYAGPMGCRTGFYLLLRDTVSRADALRLVRDAFAFIAAYTGDVPGALRQQCGNFVDHDLPGARAEAAAYATVLAPLTEGDLSYEAHGGAPRGETT